MFMQVVAIASFLAVAHAGLLLGGGLGNGLGRGLGNGIGGIGIATGGIGTGNAGMGYGGGYRAQAVDYYAPPKYEYKYEVQDYHTGDQKEKAESRIGGLTHTQYALAQKDRQVQESRVFANH